MSAGAQAVAVSQHGLRGITRRLQRHRQVVVDLRIRRRGAACLLKDGEGFRDTVCAGKGEAENLEYARFGRSSREPRFATRNHPVRVSRAIAAAQFVEPLFVRAIHGRDG